jgi:hypothetical protein
MLDVTMDGFPGSMPWLAARGMQVLLLLLLNENRLRNFLKSDIYVCKPYLGLLDVTLTAVVIIS